MFKLNFKKIKEEINKKTEENNKKKIENLVFFLILLIATIWAMNSIWGGEKKNEKNNNSQMYKELATNDSNNIIEDEYNLKEDLEKILSNIDGVGQVEVLITYSETSKLEPIYNENSTTSSTEETDTSGGKRIITESNFNKEVVKTGENGEKELVTSKVIMPKVEGAIIIAEGAKNINIKTDIINAVSAVTGLPEYKVQVFEKTRR